MADRNRLGLKVDLTSQVTKGHLLKGGIEFMRRDIMMMIIANATPADRHLMFVADEGRFGDEGVKPYSINAYVQDKMEFEGMIVNLGLRMDAFNPNARRITHGSARGSEMFRRPNLARDYAYNEGSIWSTQAPWHVVFSPPHRNFASHNRTGAVPVLVGCLPASGPTCGSTLAKTSG